MESVAILIDKLAFINHSLAMHIYRTPDSIVINFSEKSYFFPGRDWDSFINRQSLYSCLLEEIKNCAPDQQVEQEVPKVILAPLNSQEVWASGVTYLRSREARIEEAKDAKGGDFYSRVYDADRPELFFKSAPYRVIGDGGAVRIRKDSAWNVPEPELTLFICSEGSIEGYTIGNDMSSRDIEGENPLYLPQAKSYDGAAAIGPCLYVPENAIDPDTKISLSIKRDHVELFSDAIFLSKMKRTLKELSTYLFLEMSFPNGVYLMTGTGIVPSDNFTLAIGDSISISIDGIGTLTNTVTQ